MFTPEESGYGCGEEKNNGSGSDLSREVGSGSEILVSTVLDNEPFERFSV